MTDAFRRSFPLITSVLVLGWAATGCVGGSASDGAVGTSGTTPASIAVQISAQSISVENRAAQPLLDLTVAIHPMGRGNPFTTTIPRMEPGERRNLSLGNFVAGEDTRFTPFTPLPKEVVVTAVDLAGQRHDVTVPWER